MPGQQLRSSGVGPAPLRTNFQSPSRYDSEAIRRRGYHEHGILAIDLDDYRLGWADRLALKAIADKLYGAGGS